MHYAEDPGVTLDDARIAPKGAEINDQWRYKLAQILRDPPYIETHPRDRVEDPMASEYAKRVLLSIVEDNTNRYTKFRRRVVGGALAVGTWYGMVHWQSSRGPFGDVVFESLEPSQVIPCAGYLDLHDPTCPHVTIERHETVAAIEAKGRRGGWKNTGNLWPDNRGRYGTEDLFIKAHAQPSPEDEWAKDTVTVLYRFYRASQDTELADGGFRDLDVSDQYMHCPRCGMVERDHARMPDGQLPDMGMPCPACLNEARPEASYLVRVRRERLTEQRLKYPKGRLVIIAPTQRRLFYDGGWPAPTRSFPLLQLRAYESPYEQMGGCDTLLYWSLQALLDQLRKQGYDQMVTSKPILIFGRGLDGKTITDLNGDPFRYSDQNGQVAFVDDMPPGMPIQNMIHQFQGNGLPGSFPTLYSILSNSFYQTRGVGQVQFSPEQSKDVAYRSLLLQKESGDIPVDDHKQVWQEEEGLFLGCVLDVWVYNSTVPRAIRYLGADGTMGFHLLKGSDIPNVDVVVGTPPIVKQGALDEVQAINQWAQVPSPAVRRLLARRLGLNPSEVAEVEAELSGGQIPGQAPDQAAPAWAANMGGGFPPQPGV